MKTNRRKFIQTIGAGAAGIGLASTIPSFASQTGKTGTMQKTPLKMIIRAADMGYTDVCNIGAFETIERGVTTASILMLDTPGAIDAMERLRKLPWISVGWHVHFWGSPVLDPKQVPSMVIEEDGRIRFRKDLRSAEDVVFEEALMECRAQIDRCIKIMGRAPDTSDGGGSNSPFARACSQVNDEYAMVHDYEGRQTFVDGKMQLAEASDKKWADRKIYMLDAMGATAGNRTDSVQQLMLHDTFKYYAEGNAHLNEFPEGSIIVVPGFHPGWVDYYVFRQGDYGSAAWTTILSRTLDVEALCSDRMKNWIKENNIELVNINDALYGTHVYQNHLKSIGSDLAIDYKA